MAQDIYLLPGTMCDQRLWSPMVTEIEAIASEHFRFHFLTIAQLATIDNIVDDISLQLPQAPVVLLGFSLGGYLASAFAVKYPSRIAQLMVLANLPCALPEKEIKERSRTVNWIKQQGYSGIPDKRILDLLDQSAHHRKDIFQVIKAMDKSLGKQVLLHQLLATTQREHLAMKLTSLPFKKHFCVGDNDCLVDHALLQHMVESDEKMTLATINNTGHMLPLEQPRQLALWLNNILGRDISQ